MLTHFGYWLDHEMVSPCGATGDRTLCHDWQLVDCTDCLRSRHGPCTCGATLASLRKGERRCALS